MRSEPNHLGAAAINRALRKAAALVGCAAVLSVAGTAQAGEKINVTTSTNKANLPKDAGQESVVPSSDFLHSTISRSESTQGPVLPSPSQPVLLRNPKLDEWLDRKKNWIMESPNSLDRAKEVEEIFGVRKYELDNLDKRPKNMTERFFEERKDPKNAVRTRASKEGSGRDGLSGRAELDANGRSLSRDDASAADEPRGIIPELNPALLFDRLLPSDNLPALGGSMGQNSFLPKNLGEPMFGQKPPSQPAGEVTQTARDIERLLESHKTPLGRIDPINSQVDGTRSAMNPITARKTSVPLPESVQSGMGAPASAFGNSAPLVPRTDFFSSFKDRSGGGLGLNPVPAAVASSPVMQPKPALLEIPRPRF